jgi:hypothetical protein
VTLEGIESPVPYWDDPRIHNFGNNTWIAAATAPIVTKIIDVAAYDGVDLRKKILKDLNITENDTVADLCCGIGSSTADWGVGVDSSSTFLNMASFKNMFNFK